MDRSACASLQRHTVSFCIEYALKKGLINGHNMISRKPLTKSIKANGPILKVRHQICVIPMLCSCHVSPCPTLIVSWLAKDLNDYKSSSPGPNQSILDGMSKNGVQVCLA